MIVQTEAPTIPVVLPSGKVLKAEIAENLLVGLMFRENLDGAMLFVHSVPGHYPMWMYQTRMPLDILWLDATATIVEIVEGAQPCKATPCPRHGGTVVSKYALEMPAGSVGQYGLKIGQKLLLGGFHG